MKIVMVDSSRVGLKIIAAMLKDQCNDVHIFTDGLDAFEFIQQEHDVDLVLTGLELPSMSGIELCFCLQLGDGNTLFASLDSIKYCVEHGPL